MIKAGDIVCIKTTGEKVYVIDVGGEGQDRARVRRAFVGESGVYKHSLEDFLVAELETIQEHCNRQVDEMIMKGNAQKTLMIAERKFTDEMKAIDEAMDVAEAEPASGKVVTFPAAKKDVN